jgi:hypothetical protein
VHAATKRDLTARPSKYVQQSANAKSEIVGEIMGPARTATRSPSSATEEITHRRLAGSRSQLRGRGLA